MYYVLNPKQSTEGFHYKYLKRVQEGKFTLKCLILVKKYARYKIKIWKT